MFCIYLRWFCRCSPMSTALHLPFWVNPLQPAAKTRPATWTSPLHPWRCHGDPCGALVLKFGSVNCPGLQSVKNCSFSMFFSPCWDSQRRFQWHPLLWFLRLHCFLCWFLASTRILEKVRDNWSLSQFAFGLHRCLEEFNTWSVLSVKYRSNRIHTQIYLYLSICLSIYLSIYRSIHLSIYLSNLSHTI